MIQDKERRIEDYIEIYGTRVLVFLETEPQSNKYHQILLSPEMYKAMTDTVARKVSDADNQGIEQREIKTSEEEYDLPDLSEAYSDY